MKTCPVCHQELPEQEQPCPCGYAFPSKEAGQRQRRPKGSLMIAFLVVLAIAATLALKTREIGRHTGRLSRKIGTLKQANDSLQAIIQSMEHTENYYYQMGVKYREQGKYEASNKYLLDKIKRFPESNINPKAEELIRLNNADWARQLVEQGEQACRDGDRDQAAALADEIIFRFPETEFAPQARQLKNCSPVKK